jgi:hypothetical protein
MTLVLHWEEERRATNKDGYAALGGIGEWDCGFAVGVVLAGRFLRRERH